MGIFLKNFSVVFLLFSLASCFGRTSQLPRISGRELSEPERLVFIEQLHKKTDEIRNLKTISHTSLSYQSESDRFRQIFVFEKPHKVRIDFLPFNAALAFGIFVIEGEEALFIDSSNRLVRKTDSIRKAIKNVIRIPAGYDDLLSYISARVPLKFLNSSQVKNNQVIFNSEANTYYLVVKDYKYFAAINAETMLVNQFEVRDDFNGKLLLRGKYDSFSNGAIILPSSLSANLVQDEVDIRMEFNAMLANTELKAKVFNVEIPSDFKTTNQW